jgi:hypothetical protein
MLITLFISRYVEFVDLSRQALIYLHGAAIKEKLHGLSPRANYTDRATAACRQSDCQLFCG